MGASQMLGKLKLMHDVEHKYIYGPIYSWRMGVSLGIDPLSTKSKACNMNCVYCQLGKTARKENRRKIFVPTSNLINEIKTLPEGLVFDYITFSGRGEPTLARNLGAMIKAVRKLRPEKIAVITNSILLSQKSVREDLLLADYVIAKMDACSQETFDDIDEPCRGIRFSKIIQGLMLFNQTFSGKLALQIMFIQKNKGLANELSRLIRLLQPAEVQLNTPLRPGGAKPLSREEMENIKTHFAGLPVVSVYDSIPHELAPFNFKETLKRHGNYRNSSVKLSLNGQRIP